MSAINNASYKISTTKLYVPQQPCNTNYADEDGNGEEEYEVDYGSMNVSPEILRMLGAPDDVIAAKEAEISGIKWVAPEVTGLEHSDAIADFQDVAIAGDGNKRGESKVSFADASVNMATSRMMFRLNPSSKPHTGTGRYVSYIWCIVTACGGMESPNIMVRVSF